MASRLIINGDGSTEVDNDWTPEAPINLDELKSNLKNGIDSQAEVERRKYITPGSGQAMTYMQKADEAARCIGASNPSPADYPLLAAEVGITASTLQEVAQVVHAAFTNWQMIGGAIEAARLSTKAAIDAASTAADAEAAAATAIWP